MIDNLTYLNTQSTQDTDIALIVMRRLNELKKELDISILVIAHTPKINQNKPITINDLAGSKHLSNFADSVSAIGKSTKGSDIRYIKQIKASRSAEMSYDIENVIACRLVKDDCLLSFEFIGLENEYEHLKLETGNEKTPPPLKAYEVAELLKQGYTYDEIAEKLKISKGTITKWKKKYPDLFVSVSDVSPARINGNTETKSNVQ